jgi:hypothetical protein
MAERGDMDGHIVAGGGWTEQKRWVRPKYQFCSMMSWLWVFPSLGALVMLAAPRWPAAATRMEGLGMVQLQEWIAAGLLLLHVVFILLARRYDRVEKSREITVEVPVTDHDPRKLYGASPASVPDRDGARPAP